MGFENFNVMLKGGSSSRQEAIDVLAEMVGVARDEESEWTSDSRCYVFRDDRHAVELELLGSPLQVSCRFTLCHPSSVTDAFVGLVRRLMEKFEMRVTICEDVAPAAFSLDQFDAFAQTVRGCIDAPRREWKLQFGDEEMGATTGEAHRFIILPHCQPAIDKAG